MARGTCAARDCKLDEESLQVTLGGETVEVCSDDCAKKLKEAGASVKARRR